jgi:hypothetical protein
MGQTIGRGRSQYHLTSTDDISDCDESQYETVAQLEVTADNLYELEIPAQQIMQDVYINSIDGVVLFTETDMTFMNSARSRLVSEKNMEFVKRSVYEITAASCDTSRQLGLYSNLYKINISCSNERPGKILMRIASLAKIHKNVVEYYKCYADAITLKFCE